MLKHGTQFLWLVMIGVLFNTIMSTLKSILDYFQKTMPELFLQGNIVIIVPLPLAGKFFINVRTPPVLVNMVPSNDDKHVTPETINIISTRNSNKHSHVIGHTHNTLQI